MEEFRRIKRELVAKGAIIDYLSITIVRPSCAYLFCYVLEIGVVGIWLGIVCDQIVRVCLTNWRFKSGKWTKIKI